MLVNPASRAEPQSSGQQALLPGIPSSTLPTPTSHLAAYPYLFVRETDQTDYFCTVCEKTLGETELQTHLFDGHSATDTKDSFVRLQPNRLGSGGKSRLLVCVICWAKMSSDVEMLNHREVCKSSYAEDNEQRESADPTSIITTPDIHDMTEEDRDLNGVSPPPFPQPEVILDTEIGGKYDPARDNGYSFEYKSEKDPVYSSQCMQCSLCSMILPSTSYLSHLRAYHRVTCPISSLSCPLCMTVVPIMDLTVHLASQHGLVPQTAVNGLLLWVLSSNTFSLNDTAQASLKAKFKPSASVLSKPRASIPATITTTNKSSAPISVLSPGAAASVVGMFKNQTATAAATSLDSDTNLINDLRGKIGAEQLMGKLTRSHVGPGGKESHQCLICSKWYAVPPLKHMRSHLLTFKQDKRKVLQLTNNVSMCLICYRTFDSPQLAAGHLLSHADPSAVVSANQNHITVPGLPGGSQLAVSTAGGGLLAEALLGYPGYPITKDKKSDDDLSLGASYESAAAGLTRLTGLHQPSSDLSSPASSPAARGNNNNNSNSSNKDEVNIELDNAGRVKSGKVRKQCELCGEWSNIKWFFKHMSEVHQALFCRCCREYLPKDEHKEHRHWHGMPPYMGQKIRIEDGQPLIIDRKERASLTPIGSLAAWGGSSGGLVVKAVDEISRKRKADQPATAAAEEVSPSVKVPALSNSATNGDTLSITSDTPTAGRDSLMPKERCPVCAIEITHKNLARHIKLRHGIKYKFCYKCRKLIPGDLYQEHKTMHESGDIPSLNEIDYLDNLSLQGGEDGVIEIPEEVLDEVMENNQTRRKDDSFRANTSMTKLESLMGKEFKHPRRKCNICGYSVSYSNYKRHLRNAHPGLGEDGKELNENNGGGSENDEMVGHHVDDSDRILDNSGDGSEDGVEVDEVEEGDEVMEGYMECSRCGDHVMTEFMENHLKKIHGETNRKSSSPGLKEGMRGCPECGMELEQDAVIKHCRVKHKVIYKLCSACSKFIPNKLFKVHMKLHERGELEGKDQEQEQEEEEEGLDEIVIHEAEMEVDEVDDLEENHLVIDSI